jgi:NADPH-dependent curcumin reductase CurA
VTTENRQILLIARPGAAGVTAECFATEIVARPAPEAGQVLIRTIYLSIDPAARGWIAEVPNYRDPVPLGSVMPGFTLGEIAASKHPDYRVGELVYGRQGWREWAVSDGRHRASIRVTGRCRSTCRSDHRQTLSRHRIGRPKARGHGLDRRRRSRFGGGPGRKRWAATVE